MSENLALDIQQITMQYGSDEPLFSDFSVKINKGEFVAIIGPNGAGKTSLMKAIMGLEKVASGEIHNFVKDIGYVSQYLEKDIFSPLTVRELFTLKLEKAPFFFGIQGNDKKIKEALAITGMQNVLDKQVRHLSGGQYQRVMIAYALLNNPGLLILDEPVSGIDVHGEQDFFGLIESIHQKKEVTIILISHDIDVVYRYASQVICLNKKLICQGAPADVLNQKTIEKTFSSKHAIYHHQHKV